MAEGEDPNVTFGLKLGGTAFVVCDSSGELHRNELGGYSSAALVALTASEGRQLGEAAVMGINANAKGTVTDVGRLAVLPYSTLAGAPTSRH